MIAIDLADPDLPLGPPPQHLLAPVWLFGVLLPLALVGLLRHQTDTALAKGLALERRIEQAAHAEALAQKAQARQAEALRERQAADQLEQEAIALLELVPALAHGLQAGLRIEEIHIAAGEVSASGSAASAAGVSAWLSALPPSAARVAWGAPELRQAGASGGVNFSVRGQWPEAALAAPDRHAGAAP
ncbi:MAG: hypothetical protein FGM40_03910 [Rhodocyclaceae bacterium]|nr:hypothetical protein [Rhodocyclaceae bacterium]